MAEPRIRLKINLFHDVRNHDADLSDIEEKIRRWHNHPEEKVQDVRIAVGYRAGAIFLTLSDKKFTIDDITSQFRIESIVDETVDMLGEYHYADNIRKDNIRISAVGTETRLLEQ